MEEISVDRLTAVSGGAFADLELPVGVTVTLGSLGIAASSGVCSGAVAGVAGPSTVCTGLGLGAAGTGGILVTGTATTGGGVLAGVGVVPVATCVAAAAGGYMIGDAIGRESGFHEWLAGKLTPLFM